MTVKAAHPPLTPSFSPRFLPACLAAVALSCCALLAASHLTRDSETSAPPPIERHAVESDAPPSFPVAEPAPIVPRTATARATGHFLGLIPDAPPPREAMVEPAPAKAESAPLPPRRPQFAHEVAPSRPAPGPIPAAPAPAEPRGLFERLFNIQPSTGQALAYARPDAGFGSGSLADKPMPMGYEDGRTAVYDITAKTVFMPNGEKLEAHSGLGPLLDDPGNVHVKNRGATPPNVYNLSLRESLFHGVQALRMTPVSGSTMYGRDGILAHSYLLGPNGDSNGCVSFKDYDRFLQAFNAGHVKRIIVVARRG